MPVRTLGRTRLIQEFTIGPVDPGNEDYIYGPASDFGSVMLFVEVKNTVTDDTDAFTANVADSAGDIPVDTIYGKVGDKLKFSFNVLKIGSDIVIRVVNNESDPLTFRIIRITF